MDIKLYTLDFTDMFILPQSSGKGGSGYSSISAEIELNGSGSFQFVFRDDELEAFIKSHPEGAFLKWGKFEGYVTDYQFKHYQKTIYGSHLNALAHKYVIPVTNLPDEYDGEVNESIDEAMSWLINKYVPGITYVPSGLTDVVEFSTDTCKYADEFFKEYLSKAKLAYEIYIDQNLLKLKVISPEENPEVLSIGNKNVYEIQEDFSNKTIAFGGWYKNIKEEIDDEGINQNVEEWLYISTSEKTGIYKQDVILEANSPSAAMDELKTYENQHSYVCKTRNIEYQTDYKLGDIIRFQTDGKTVKKQITSVDMWFEGATYHEEPTLSEWEE